MREVLLLIFSGMSLAFAGLSLAVLFFNRKQKLYALFGFFSLFSGLYFLTAMLMYDADADLRWMNLLAAACYYAVFPWFLFMLVEKQYSIWLVIVSAIFPLAFLAYLFIPESNGIGIWQIIAHVGLIGLMIISVQVCHCYQSQNLRGRRTFFVLCVLFITLGIEEILHTYTGMKIITPYTSGIPPLDIYPLMFTIVMGIRMSNDFIFKKEMELQRITNELNENKLELARVESMRLKEEIKYKQKDLLFLGIELNHKTDYETAPIDRLSQLKEKNKIDTEELNELIRFAKERLRIDKSKEYFHVNTERVNHEFLSNLKKSYPDLTENELHLCSLLRLKLNTKEISVIKSISPDSVKVMRYRLRKKLSLDRKTNLTDFIVRF